MNVSYQILKEVLVNFLKEETEKTGLNNLVIGLSGGVDSALSAALAVEALGKDHVFAYCLPYKTSSSKSLEDAKKVAGFLGINCEVIDISPYADAYLNVFDHYIGNVRFGNVCARMRMVTLFDLSAAHGALVLGTSNKTELLLGYGTWYGDMASALNPVGDLYKTQVWGLAEYMGIPKEVIEKHPTADLWQDQTDEGELGFSYRDVDKLLFEMIDKRKNKKELIRMGFDEKFIDEVTRRIKANQFKRCLPVVAKVSDRTVGVDFRYSRDWGL